MTRTIDKGTAMTFAPGWTQIIDTDGPEERDDLINYISDTFKAVNGYRPRNYQYSEMTLDYLREMARSLEQDVLDQAEEEERYYAYKCREKAAHKAAMRYYTNLKPRCNTMATAFKDAKDRI